MGNLPSPLRPSRVLLLAAFGLFVAFFVVTHVVTMRQLSAARAATEDVASVFSKAELVSRMSRDINQKRVLTHVHILEKDPRTMADLEEEIAKLHADYSTTAAAFEPLAHEPGASIAWQKLQDDVAAIGPTLDRVLALSRKNVDAQAWGELSGLFDVIEDDLDALQHLNRDTTEKAVAAAKEVQRSSAMLINLRTAAGIFLSLAVGAFIIHRVGRSEDEARRQRVALQASNEELEAFAGRVAHDLRGPLTTASVASSQLARVAPEHTAMTALLRRSVTRMEVLIEDLLALSRLGANVQEGVSDPAATVAHLREDQALFPPGEGAKLHVDVESASVRCGEGLLRQVLWNLADNAMKYRRLDVAPELEIRGRARGKGYELMVRDNGLGMSAEDLRHAFDPFYRALQTRAKPGTGLGLTIVKRVIEASGGTVSVESQLGQGTTFVIRLPMAESAAPHTASDPIHGSRAPA